MSIAKHVVKAVPFIILAFLLSCAVAAEGASLKAHLLYFYNPTCRLCTSTNEVIAQMEEKYKDVMTFQRFDIASPEEGTDNVLYMFDLMDELQVPEENETTLVVFVGLLEEEGGEVFFIPKRVLIEGEEIIAKLDGMIQEFFATDGKGGESVGEAPRPASFFLPYGPCRHTSA